jgi:hypothetical protein
MLCEGRRSLSRKCPRFPTIFCALLVSFPRSVLSVSTFRRYDQPHAVSHVRSVPKLRQMAYRARAWVLASFLARSSDQRLVCETAFDASEQVIHPAAHFHVAPVEAPSHFSDVAVQMLVRYPMVDGDNLSLQKRPNRLDAVRMNAIVPNEFARAMIHAVNVIFAVEPEERAILVRHQG